MRVPAMRMVLSGVVAVLAGCGGGGGGGGGGISLTFNPGTLTASFYEGDAQQLTVEATAQGSSSGTVYIRIIDSSGVLQSTNPQITAEPGGSYQVVLQAATTLSVGTHSGAFQITLCSDSACTGSEGNATLPYSLTVLSNTNLTPLTPLAGAGDWSTVQGTAIHSGHVPGTLDPAKFTSRWRWLAPDYNSSNATPPLQVTVSGGVAYLSTSQYNGPNKLYALSEASGTLSWSHDFGTQNALYQPAVAGGTAYVVNQTGGGPMLWLLDAASGATSAQTGYGGGVTGQPLSAPVVADGVVVTGGVQGFDPATGKLLWTSDANAVAAVAADSQYFYKVGVLPSGQFGGLTLITPSTGAVVSSINDPAANSSPPLITEMTPALSGNEVIAAAGDHLVDFNISGQKVKWSVPGTFYRLPSVANGTVYVVDGDTGGLQAVDQASGQKLWAWAPPGNSSHFMWSEVVTSDNLAFLSVDQAVYAIDLTTHQQVWSYPHAGALSISANGVLYVSRDDGYLTAINLH